VIRGLALDSGREEKVYLVEEVFPEGIAPGEVLRGLRYREGLTQAKLAALVGLKSSNISDRVNGLSVRRWQNGWPRPSTPGTRFFSNNGKDEIK